MRDSIRLDFGQLLVAKSGSWYKVLQTLGAGGNAVTFLVLATSGLWHGQLLAMKVFRRLSKPERRDSFLKEIEFLQTCNHPAIMRVFDEGVFLNEHPFVVAEYLPITLRQLFRIGAPTVVKLSLTLQLLSALNYLAALPERVVHRDIKPENVFIKDRTAVLGDFGLLKKVAGDAAGDPEFLKESVGPGMPRWYRTPDLVAYARRDVGLESIAHSDVFQLGLVLAELFTGKNPAIPPDESDLLAPVRMDPLSTIPGALGIRIQSLIVGMLAHDSGRRSRLAELLPAWQDIFEDAAKRVNQLEGRVF